MTSREERIFNHVFFPPRLPTGLSSGDIEEEQAMHDIVQRFTESVATFLDSGFPSVSSPMSSMLVSFAAFDGTADKSEAEFADALRQLRHGPGQFLPIIFKHHNMTLCFQCASERVLVAFFNMSDRSAVVMSGENSGDGSCQLPRSVVDVAWDWLDPDSDVGAAVPKILADLYASDPNDIASYKCSKADSDNVGTMEVKNPLLVSGLFADIMRAGEGSSDLSVCSEIKISKKMRDCVEWNQADLPWRRSGVWFSLKAVTQWALSRVMLDQFAAKVAYKASVLHFLFNLLEDFALKVSVEKLSFGVKRIARRLLKMKQHSGFQDSICDFSVSSFIEHVSERTHAVSEQIAAAAEQFRADRAQETEIVLNPSKINAERDTWLSLDSSQPLLAHIFSQHLRAQESLAVRDLHCLCCFTTTEGLGVWAPHLTALRCWKPPRLSDALPELPASSFRLDLATRAVGKHVFESLVLGTGVPEAGEHPSASPCLWRQADMCHANFDSIVNAFKHCTSAVAADPLSDPVSNGRSILTIATLLCIIDRAVCQTYPKVAEHPLDLQFSLVLQRLLLRNREDLEHLSELERYLEERDEGLVGLPVLEFGAPQQGSFAVKYA